MSVEMTPENKKKIAVDCFRKGNDAMEKRNFDYAVKMHGTAVQLVPDSLVYRQTLRGCERYLYNNNKTGAKLAGIRVTGIRNKVRKARSKSDWLGMDQAAEEGLTLNPWDPHLNVDVGDACFQLGYTEIAEFAYRTAAESDGDNKEIWQKLGDIYELRGKYSEAIDCWKRIAKLDPNNGKVRAKITGLQATSVTVRGGYEDAKSTQEVRRNAYDDYRPATQKHVPDVVSGPGVSLEADLQRAIRKNPTETGSYQKLAEYYQQQKEFAKAAELLKRALDISGGNYNFRELLEKNDLERLRLELELAKTAAANDPAQQANVDALKRELHLREIEVYSMLVERYPMDASNKFELAQRYMKSKDHKKAIPLLQKATADTRRAGEVLVALGRCFLEERQFPLARHQFEKAIEKLNPHDHPEQFCEAHYALARLYERAGERETAEAHYNEVLGVDYAYRDARERLEKLQGAGDGEKDDSD